MKSKKLIISGLALVMVLTTFAPSVFSWYDRGDFKTNSYFGYVRDNSNRLPVSAVDGSEINFRTVSYDDKDSLVGAGFNDITEVINSSAANISVPADTVQKYATKIFNGYGSDVYVGMYLSNSSNDAAFFTGSYSPTVNEKSYAARSTKSFAADGRVRVYFEHRSVYTYWSRTAASGQSGQFDMNIRYFNSNGDAVGAWNNSVDAPSTNTAAYRMTKCDYKHRVGNTDYDVYYFDLPAGTSSFFFYNDYYTENSGNSEYLNRSWNRTPSITNFAAGTLYYMTNNVNDDKNKVHATETVADMIANGDKIVNGSTVTSITETDGLANFTDYIGSIRMANNSSVKFDLAQGKNYTGSSIAYAEGTDSNNRITVNAQGALVYSQGYTAGDANLPTVRTTVTGMFHDAMYVDTKIDIPSTVSQVPVIENIKVPANDSVIVEWFVRNNGSSADRFSTLFLTQ